MIPYEINFPDYLDDYEGEIESKGYLSGVSVVTSDSIFELTVYDRTRLMQEVDDELKSDRAYFAASNLVIVPAVTKTDISGAVERIARGNFSELLPKVAE
ncbi:hypothetical protein [Actinoplanes solisilvae]|uniref:hypothetical protein n=1 Tax=Actinoplanes solisilvae TaxID=2486853 RepID=UPI000FDA9A68|nr:hypothetical protein [Actinoplanes solisilvae]